MFARFVNGHDLHDLQPLFGDWGHLRELYLVQYCTCTYHRYMYQDIM